MDINCSTTGDNPIENRLLRYKMEKFTHAINNQKGFLKKQLTLVFFLTKIGDTIIYFFYGNNGNLTILIYLLINKTLLFDKKVLNQLF